MIGFELIEENLKRNFEANKLHHGIIIAGKKGIGKASFIKQFCQKILHSNGEANADFRIVEKIDDKKTIGIEEIRKQSEFLNQTSAISEYKFLIIDSACELTSQASNSLLKTLEEPKNNNFLILITHNLSKIIPTIRSRCFIAKVPEFSSAQFFEILNQNKINNSENEKFFLAQICDNCPALAIEFGNDLVRFYQLFLQSILNQKISEELLKKISEKNSSFIIFEKILLHFFSQWLKSNNKIIVDFYFSEQEVFDFLLPKFSASQILNLAQESLTSLEKASTAHLDKKLNLTNIFNKICYV
jgi:DNA polymerase III delta prime subunit